MTPNPHMYACSSYFCTHIHTVPSEHVVISKERATGTYHLSAYYLAKTLSELPLLLLLPSIFIIPVYWAAGLNGPASFFGTWFILLTNCFVAQVSEYTSCQNP